MLQPRRIPTMNVAIMQPYFFPYAGYFQLLKAADIFVVHDDVQYIKGGWINRNRILLDGQPFGIVRPVASAPHQLAINQRFYMDDQKSDTKLLRLIETAYRKAPHFASVYPLLRELLALPERNVATFNTSLLRRLSTALELSATIIRSSELALDSSLHGAERVLEICRRVGARRYINLPGGAALYSGEHFAGSGLQLRFLHPQLPAYPQFGEPHVAGLSIIDLMMFNTEDALAALLSCYSLVEDDADTRAR